jgi:predicted nucleic acid-binding protein
MSAQPRRVLSAGQRVVLDSGAVTALTGRSPRARAWFDLVALHRGSVVVPAAVLVECTSGHAGRDAEVNRVLKRVLPGRAPAPIDAATARRAGALRFAAHHDDGIDAIVAAEATGVEQTCVVLTTDPDDLRALTSGFDHVMVRAL